jgi:hypothetical protein
MSIEDLESEALKLAPTQRAKLAETLLRSLEALSADENELLWIEEAERRNSEWDAGNAKDRPAAEVFRDVKSHLL